MRRIPEELFNKRDLAVVGELFAPDYIEHVPLPPEFPSGIARLNAYVISAATLTIPS